MAKNRQRTSKASRYRIKEITRGPVIDGLRLLMARGDMQPGTRAYRMGKCRIYVSPPVPEWGMGWHMSISTPDRLPTWDEVAYARYQLIPQEAYMVLPLPPDREYINVHEYTFQLREVTEVVMAEYRRRPYTDLE